MYIPLNWYNFNAILTIRYLLHTFQGYADSVFLLIHDIRVTVKALMGFQV